jgi:hypothetical protein
LFFASKEDFGRATKIEVGAATKEGGGAWIAMMMAGLEGGAATMAGLFFASSEEDFGRATKMGDGAWVAATMAPCLRHQKQAAATPQRQACKRR